MLGVHAILTIEVILLRTTAVSVKIDMAYPEVTSFFAKGETWLLIFVLVSAL